MNRLARESSPYLLQHQHNPVDWHPWGDDAFALARARDVPIFLSVGYSTCYWCHVMERESFEREDVAAELNRFVCVKVDREERPDVDQLYMTAVQLYAGRGGWPMSLFLTPALKPFYAATYLPPHDAGGHVGVVTVCRAIEDAWKNQRAEIERAADNLLDGVRRASAAPPAGKPFAVDELPALVDRAVADFDAEHGGFGGAPKFPQQTLLSLLLATLDARGSQWDARRAGYEAVLRRTLDAMADGGIRDHLGGGFHRYSTDAQWLVPHFELMLYDQAMLAPVYARASAKLNEPRYARIAREVCDFVLRELTGDDGLLFTGLDAEAEAQEGKTYLWTPAEVAAVLGAERAEKFNLVYGLDAGFNFADPHGSSHEPHANVLFLNAPPAEEDDADVRAMRAELLAARKTRAQPTLDTKIITSWNGLMIGGLAVVGKELDEPRYVEAAARCADRLLALHQTADGTLFRTSRDGVAKLDATLDDYAHLALGVAQLIAAGEARFAAVTHRLLIDAYLHFHDPSWHERPALYTSAERPDLLVRQVTANDSPLPSGNAAFALAHLAATETTCRPLLAAFAPAARRHPEGFAALIEAALRTSWVEGSASNAEGDVEVVARRVGAREVEVRASEDVKAVVENGRFVTAAGGLKFEPLRITAAPGSVGVARVMMESDTRARVTLDADGPAALLVRVAACDERGACRRPETLRVEVA